ncbi:hypothetical protein O206_19660 [Ochrobactrum sp. EGD-AQ16]|jgi:hypothetical protein|nr:hypothetical protein O206_19660 [Ochrobactrum sp. EGD-AQ16]
MLALVTVRSAVSNLGTKKRRLEIASANLAFVVQFLATSVS